ncbi:MAG: putative ABC transporter permease [Clostridia bacterium]
MNEEKLEVKEKINKITRAQNENAKINIKKKLTINGISIWRILAYFIIYSVAGYVIETVYGMITKGVWESRQSFLYGPFCGIYGLGAVVMIVCLYKIPKKINALFAGGFVVGSIVEYAVSFIGEKMLGIKWWDYSGMPLNINGRICVYYSIFWGFLAIYLIASLNPKIDKIIDWTKSKFKTYKGLKTFVTITCIFLFID